MINTLLERMPLAAVSLPRPTSNAILKVISINTHTLNNLTSKHAHLQLISD